VGTDAAQKKRGLKEEWAADPKFNSTTLGWRQFKQKRANVLRKIWAERKKGGVQNKV